jgi:N-acetylglutamate synthase/N-acetylornithine aminotransferase
MKKVSFYIGECLKMDKTGYKAYGCDLSYEYVKINAEYGT